MSIHAITIQAITMWAYVSESGFIDCGTAAALSLELLAMTVRSRYVTDASVISSQPTY